ncbi:MAG: NAD(P)-dependent oxidoreductase [Brevinema sp.]
MKILVYAVRQDEIELFHKWSQIYHLDITLEKQNLTKQTVHLAEKFNIIVFLAEDNLNQEVLQVLKSYHITTIFSRSVGVDNVDLTTTQELGIQVANVPGYSPNSVSEFTLLLTLSLLRNYKQTLQRTNNQDFTILGLVGREIRNQTVAVIGVGRIGCNTLKHFVGFSPKELLAFDKIEHEEVKHIARYTTLDEIYQKSDVIIYHVPLNQHTYHMINKNSLSKMKDGVILVNTSRGAVMNAEDTLEFVRSGKISGIALDVYEYEIPYYRHDWREKYIPDNILREFIAFPNVIITPHIAFYTDEAVSNMISTTLSNIREFLDHGSCINFI